MSIPLILLRLEIAEDCLLLPHIHYTAPKYQKKMEPKPEPKRSFSGDDIEKNHRGSREIKDISIESLSFEEESGCCSKVKDKEKEDDCPVHSERKLAQLNQVQFTSGNHYVDVTKGILYLFKENKRTPLGEEAERSEMICILGVPTSMTIHNLLQFTSPVNENISHIRIIRENRPNSYMALIKFRNQKSSDEFYNNFNEVPFNSIEPEVCHLVYVAKVETIKEDGYLPVPGHTELPTCPVCLERMDESVEGILTILCNHSFHSGCLNKWGDTSCPVCRYCQTPDTVAENHCFQCGSNDSLWICLICGHIGCGRYVEGHAYNHYVQTQHTYAMQLGSNNRVWDYAGDNYVHRLLQNKADGKPVELECSRNDDKIDSVQLEYTYLLTNQLEAQRLYFEESISRLENNTKEQIKELIQENEKLKEEKGKVNSEYEILIKDKQILDKKVNQLSVKLSKAIHDLQEEKEINKYLRENQEIWNTKLQQSEKALKSIINVKDDEINELKDQLRDLMFFIEAQNKLKDVKDTTREEIEESQIVVPESSSSASSKKRSSRKKNTRK